MPLVKLEIYNMIIITAMATQDLQNVFVDTGFPFASGEQGEVRERHLRRQDTYGYTVIQVSKTEGLRICAALFRGEGQTL